MADLSVLCQVRCLTYAFCYQFLVIFPCFGIFHHGRTVFTFILPEVKKSCKSCKPIKSTYNSFASLNRVQIWPLSQTTSHSIFKRCKNAMSQFIKQCSKLLCYVSFVVQYIICFNNITYQMMLPRLETFAPLGDIHVHLCYPSVGSSDLPLQASVLFLEWHTVISIGVNNSCK